MLLFPDLYSLNCHKKTLSLLILCPLMIYLLHLLLLILSVNAFKPLGRLLLIFLLLQEKTCKLLKLPIKLRPPPSKVQPRKTLQRVCTVKHNLIQLGLNSHIVTIAGVVKVVNSFRAQGFIHGLPLLWCSTHMTQIREH